MNFYSIGAIWCRVKGHRWSHAKDIGVPFDKSPLILRRVKRCLRCGLEREVKTRGKKA
jgi:hypothetical protein